MSKLLSLSLEQYRNIDTTTIECPERGILFIGNNGQGKTNILESIYALSIGKPFRATTLYEAIQEDKKDCHIVAQTSSELLEIHGASFPRKQSLYQVNGVKKSFFDFLGHFYAVLFAPEDLNIIRGTPSIRRDYLDSVLIRMDPLYARELIQYEKTIKQRNALLKMIADGRASRSDLEIWNELLCNQAKPLWNKRKKLVEAYQKLLEEKYNILSRKTNLVRLIYSQKQDSENMLDDLQRREEKDIILGNTTVGPHRDDFSLELNERAADHFASQGEVRSLVLALKHAEVEILEDHHKKAIVLLLDDVFSELDESRQESLLELIKKHQTFISTTHLSNIIPDMKTLRIKEGLLAMK